MRLHCRILSPISRTSELNGMKHFAIQNRVLQRDHVLQRRVLERYYCTTFRALGIVRLQIEVINDLADRCGLFTMLLSNN